MTTENKLPYHKQQYVTFISRPIGRPEYKAGSVGTVHDFTYRATGELHMIGVNIHDTGGDVYWARPSEIREATIPEIEAATGRTVIVFPQPETPPPHRWWDRKGRQINIGDTVYPIDSMGELPNPPDKYQYRVYDLRVDGNNQPEVVVRSVNNLVTRTATPFQLVKEANVVILKGVYLGSTSSMTVDFGLGGTSK